MNSLSVLTIGVNCVKVERRRCVFDGIHAFDRLVECPILDHQIAVISIMQLFEYLAYLGDILHDDHLESITIGSKRLLQEITLGHRPCRAPDDIPSLEQVLYDPCGNVSRRTRYEHFGRWLNGRHRSLLVPCRQRVSLEIGEVSGVVITLCNRV